MPQDFFQIHQFWRVMKTMANRLGNLKTHVEDKCAAWKAQLDPKQPSLLSHNPPIVGSSQPTPGLLPGMLSKEAIRIFNDKVAEWIIDSSVPLRIVDNEKFRELFRTINENIHIYSRRDLGRRIANAFKNAQIAIKSSFSTFQGEVALTTDGWTSGALEGYMGVTVHWIDENWKPCRMVLDIVEAPQSHTAENLRDALMEVIGTYNLHCKVVAITTDNAENMIVACKLIGRELQGDHFVHLRCSAHIVNLVTNTAFELIKTRLENLRDVIALLGKSTKVNREYQDLADTDEEWKLRQGDNYTASVATSKRKISLDCKTRWSSTHRMLDKCLRVSTSRSCR